MYLRCFSGVRFDNTFTIWYNMFRRNAGTPSGAGRGKTGTPNTSGILRKELERRKEK